MLESPEAAVFGSYIDEYLIDPEGVHHEFSQDHGLHGQKIDCDKIPDNSEIFESWVDVNVAAIKRLFPNRPNVLLSVDSGTNRLVAPVAKRVGYGAVALMTKKVSKNQVELDDEAKARIGAMQDPNIVVLEDVASEGTSSASAVRECRALGSDAIVLNTIQRSTRLIRLDEIGAKYYPIVLKLLPNYTPEECRSIGYCAAGWELIPHASKH